MLLADCPSASSPAARSNATSAGSPRPAASARGPASAGDGSARSGRTSGYRGHHSHRGADQLGGSPPDQHHQPDPGFTGLPTAVGRDRCRRSGHGHRLPDPLRQGDLNLDVHYSRSRNEARLSQARGRNGWRRCNWSCRRPGRGQRRGRQMRCGACSGCRRCNRSCGRGKWQRRRRSLR